MESIEIELKEAQNDAQKEFERIHTYFVNKYQEMMYHTIKAERIILFSKLTHQLLVCV